MRRQPAWCILVEVTLLIILSATIRAGIPHTINYQGSLTAADGTPVTDGNYLIRFQIYETAVEGAAIWDSDYQELAVKDGLFTYALGTSVPLSSALFNVDIPLYLGVKVGAEAEINPRTMLVSVPYAFMAAKADTAAYALNAPGGGDITSVSAGDGLSGGASSGAATLSVAKDGIASTHIADETITSDDLAKGSVDVDEIADGAVTTAALDKDCVVSGHVQDGALSDRDLADEPGVAWAAATTAYSLTPATGFIDLLTVSVDAPTSGYVVVTGSYVLVLQSHYDAFSWVSVQIDTAAGGFAAAHGMTTTKIPLTETEEYLVSGSTVRVFEVDAGITEFRLEGLMDDSYGAYEAGVTHQYMTATFYPTAYQSSAVSTGNEGESDMRPAVESTGGSNSGGQQ